MIKSKPNSNLLTVADSPFQHHLVSLIIYLYIHRYIQMVLDASTTKEESLAYNPQGGRIVLHTACDKEVATFAFGQEAQWRNGKDNRLHLYVEGNPVSYRDESGNNAIIGQLNAIMKHMMGSIKIGDKIGRSIGRGLDYSMRKAGRGIDGAARQLASGGKYSRNKGNDLDAAFSAIGIDTRQSFKHIERGDLGDFVTKQGNDIRNKRFSDYVRKPARDTKARQKEDKQKDIWFAFWYVVDLSRKCSRGGCDIRDNQIPDLEPGQCNSAGGCRDIEGNLCSINLLQSDGKCKKPKTMSLN